MALTFRRWLALAVVLCAIAAVIVLHQEPSRPVEWTERARLRERMSDARASAAQAAERVRRLAVRDSVVRVLGAARGAVTVFDRGLDTATRARLEQLADDARARQTANPIIPTQVAFVFDTVTNVRGVGRSGFGGALATDYLLPSAETGNRCVVLVRVRSFAGEFRRFTPELESDVTRRRLMGPCAFYETFGKPGARVAEWLRARGYTFAQSAEWPAVDPWIAPEWFAQNSQLLALHDLINDTGVSCAAGNDSACVAAVLDPRVAHRQSPYSDGAVSLVSYNPYFHGDRPWITSWWPLGSREWTVLGDMVRTLGPERFEAFWKSDAPVPDAFQQAAGRSLASWTREWILTTYRLPQASPRYAGFGWGGVIMLAGVALAVAAARRRQVG